MMADFSREQVAKHNKAGDACLVIGGRVYDVSKFAAVHPGGERLLMEYAGKDATDVFYKLHRKEVLERIGKNLLVGVVPGAQDVPVTRPAVSEVPFAENVWLREHHRSPYYSQSHSMYHAEVRSLLAGVRDEADRLEEAGKTPPKALFKALGSAGFLACRIGPLAMSTLPEGIVLPGGVKPGEFDYFHELIAHEEMGCLGTPSMADGIGGGMVIGLPPVLVFAESALASRVSRDVLTGEKQIALAISEPFAGSDVANIQTTAVKTPDGKHYLVNGIKKWITNGTFADYFTTAVRTGDDGIGGISLLLIERSAGLTTEAIPVMYGSSAGTALVTLENVIVPVDHLIGVENEGFKAIMANFNHERWLINAGVLRGTRAMVEECFKWVNQRETFGSKLVEKPVIRLKLARMAAAVDAAHAWLEVLTFQMQNMDYMDQAKHLAGPLALHKHFVTRTATLVADEAMQIFGGRALTKTGMGRFCERFWRSVKFGAILGGSEEIMADLGIKQAMRNWPPTARL